MKNPASLLLALAVGSVAVMAMAKASGPHSVKPPPVVKTLEVNGQVYRVTRMSDGRYLIEQIGTDNAMLFEYGDSEPSCKGDCDQIVLDMQDFPADLMSS